MEYVDFEETIALGIRNKPKYGKRNIQPNKNQGATATFKSHFCFKFKNYHPICIKSRFLQQAKEIDYLRSGFLNLYITTHKSFTIFITVLLLIKQF